MYLLLVGLANVPWPHNMFSNSDPRFRFHSNRVFWIKKHLSVKTNSSSVFKILVQGLARIGHFGARDDPIIMTRKTFEEMGL